jgi:hypothetical protein
MELPLNYITKNELQQELETNFETMTAKLLEALGVSQQVQEQKLTTLKEYLVEQDSSIKQSVERVELDVQLGNQQRDEVCNETNPDHCKIGYG